MLLRYDNLIFFARLINKLTCAFQHLHTAPFQSNNNPKKADMLFLATAVNPLPAKFLRLTSNF